VELLPDMSNKEEFIFQQLSWNPIHIDELCIQLKNDTPEVLSIQLILELKNIVQQHPGKLFTESV
jgi:predicted Rossmann fold nucleotide-binding protein DprA/Smf involved in DNA uptake